MADKENSSTEDNTSHDSSVKNSSTTPTSSKVKEEHDFTEDEEALIIRMYNLVGERWSLIAGRIPGRTAEQIEKYWNSRSSTSQ